MVFAFNIVGEEITEINDQPQLLEFIPYSGDVKFIKKYLILFCRLS